MLKGCLLRIAAVAVLVVLFSASAAVAQVGWLNPHFEQHLGFEFNKPFFNDSFNDESAWSLFMSGEFSVKRSVNIILELPLFHSSYDWNVPFEPPGFSTSKTFVGNPLIGVRLSENGTGNILEFGLRLPLVTDNAEIHSQYAILSHYLRGEAFAQNTVTLQAQVGYRYVSNIGLILIVAGGPLALLSTDDYEYTDDEFFGNFTFQVWTKINRTTLGGTFSSRVWLSESNIDFGERLDSELRLAVRAQYGQVVPGAHIVVPLDDFVAEFVDVVVGLNIAYFFAEPAVTDRW